LFEITQHDQLRVSLDKRKFFFNNSGFIILLFALNILVAELKTLSTLPDEAGGWSHKDQATMGPDNQTGNNKMKVYLG